MTAPDHGSLRDRRHTELLRQIHETAHRLFGERGYAAVTTEDIAAAAGISISTYFRHVPTKEGLLVEPARQAVAKIVAAYGARPVTESAVQAMIRLFVENTRRRTDRKLESWQRAILTNPRLLAQSALVCQNEGRRLIELVGVRMDIDPTTDMRPSLLVHTGLGTAQFVLRRWLSTDQATTPPLHVQMEESLRISLAGFERMSGSTATGG